ncbi:hypothetical protein OG257_30050 [Streptomyces sp. NBC_00683]|uniref:hypothetical protein n=1 Tax=Streptomyces sp. NBC_00683 TaxID=2903670 RepID=UPI002E37475F|nr:hypothetical protein [Streptomyces sp. NBC_00683]
MNNAGRRPDDPPSEAQRRVRRSPLLFTAPLVLLGLLVLVLFWEAVRANVTADARTEWPWRLQLLEMEALGSLLAVAVGAVLARAQYARTVRPYLGWRGAWAKGLLKADAQAWRVGILNGGQHIAAIEAFDCRVVLAGETESGAAPWVDVSEAVAELTAAGLVVAEDFQLVEFGRGFPLVGTGSYETVLVGAFSKRFVEKVDALYVRVRVTDVVGDSHERIGDCMKSARGVVHAPLD